MHYLIYIYWTPKFWRPSLIELFAPPQGRPYICYEQCVGLFIRGGELLYKGLKN